MENPIRGDVTRAELDELGMKYFVDVRTTARRMLEPFSRSGGENPYEGTAHLSLELPGKPPREVRVTLRAGAETIVPGPGADEETP